MGFWAFFNHVGNFVLPAFWLATGLLLVHRLLHWRQGHALRWWRHWLWLFGSGVLVLLGGLAVFQRDGKMLTYIALAMVPGLVHAWLTRRKGSHPQ